MPIVIASVLVQILCAVHCVRGGRNQLWLMVIIFLSLPGCAAYAFFEILPEFVGSRAVRKARSAAVKSFDPERELRRARQQLDMADTAANHAALGDALGDLGRWADAIPHYEKAVAKAPGTDRVGQLKLARACFEAGQSARARALLEALPSSGSQTENDRAALLHARLLEADGETGRALAIYAEIGERMIGAEALCRHAAILMRQGRNSEALPLLAEAAKRARQMDRFERARNAEMYDWAAEQFAVLERDRL